MWDIWPRDGGKGPVSVPLGGIQSFERVPFHPLWSRDSPRVIAASGISLGTTWRAATNSSLRKGLSPSHSQVPSLGVARVLSQRLQCKQSSFTPFHVNRGYVPARHCVMIWPRPLGLFRILSAKNDLWKHRFLINMWDIHCFASAKCTTFLPWIGFCLVSRINSENLIHTVILI